MNKDISKKLEEVLKGVDASIINNSKKSVENLMKTSEGKKIQQQLSGLDKDKILETFMKMDTNEIKEKLNHADLSALSGLSAEEIMKKLR